MIFNPWEMIWNEPQKAYMNSVQKEVFFSGGNQIGKSASSCAMLAFHLTGDYPDWYTGRKFEEPPRTMLIGETFTTARDLLVSKVIGTEHERGAIERDRVFDIEKLARNGVGGFKVAHSSKRMSNVIVASYASGRRRVQGHSLDLVVIDEEPPMDVYDELSARTNATGGFVRISATPLSGYTELFTHFETDETGSKEILYYKVEDALHMEESVRLGLIQKYKEHPQGDARLNGRPCLWEGAVFGLPQHEVIWNGEGFEDSKVILGIDIPHTTGTFACVKMRYDDYEDTVLVEEEAKVTNVGVEAMADIIKSMGGDRYPVAWPHDARIKKAEGVLVDVLSSRGCKMLPQPAFMVDNQGKKNRSLVAIATIASEMEREGRLLYHAQCGQLLRERTQYQILEGAAAKRLDDHLIDAMFKGLMMLKYAADESGVDQPKMPSGLLNHLNRDFFGG